MFPLRKTLSSYLCPVASSGTMKKLAPIGSRIAFALTVFLVLAAAILTRPPKPLDEFDQPFYLTVAYDLIHNGVFSNGFVSLGNTAGATPSPGMFYGPLYPSLIAGRCLMPALPRRSIAGPRLTGQRGPPLSAMFTFGPCFSFTPFC